MKSKILFAVITMASLATSAQDLSGKPEPHFFFQKAAHVGGGVSNPLLQYYGGPVLHSSKAAAIFWGSQWQDPTFAGDKITGLGQFFSGMSGSQYSMTPTEYFDSAGKITSTSTYLGAVLDSSTPPSRAPRVSAIVAEACRATGNNPDPAAVYFVYTSTSAGQVNYCAWHSAGNCSNGAPVQVAYMPNIDGIGGCDPLDTSTGHSEGLSALANVTAHEWMEAITDPRLSAWYDSSGGENGDKCAWSFPPVLSTFNNQSQWKLQMEWSNAAFTAGTGLANRSGQKGCIY